MTPRFVPFAAMTDAEQREHLQRVHGCHRTHVSGGSRTHCHELGPWDGDVVPPPPHTHDKPAPRTEENR